MNKTDKSKLIPHVDYLASELSFLPLYKKEIDWKVYESQRSKRLEVERWVECIINSALDFSKMLLIIKGEVLKETSREILFQIGSRIFDREDEAEMFSELARIRNTLAHRYLDLRWQDIKRFFEVSSAQVPAFIDYIKKEIQGPG